MALEREDRDAIIDAISAGFSAASRNQQNQAPGSNNNSQNQFSKNLGAAATTVFDRLVNEAGGSIKANSQTIAKATPIFDGLAGSAAATMGYLEDTHATFQALSKVGAGFEGNLMQLRMGAAETRMSLGDFANMVGNNATQLSGFAGGVKEGTRRFRELSSTMFQGDNPLIERFQRLGYNVNEANEFILQNMEFQRRQQKFQGPEGDKAMLEASLRMAASLDVMAKVSGKQLEEMKDDLIARQRAGATQARLRLLEKQGVEGAQEAYAAAQTSLAGAPKVTKDLLDELVQTGAPMTQATKNFAATNKEAYAALVAQAQAIKSGDKIAAEGLGKQATAATAAYADSAQGLALATLAGVSDVAEGQAKVLESVSPIIDAIHDTARRTGQSLDTTEDYVNTFNTMIGSITAKQLEQMAGTGEGQQTAVQIQKAQLALLNSSSKLNTEIATQIQSSTKLTTAIQTILNMMTKSVEGTQAAGSTAAAAVGGVNTPNNTNLPANDPRRTNGGNIDPTEVEREALRKWREEVGLPPTEGRAIGGDINAGQVYKVGERGPETMIAGMDGAIIPNMKSMLNRLPDMAKQLQQDMAMTGMPMSQAAQAQAAMANMSSSDIGALIQQAQTTNELLSRLLGVNTTQVTTAEKQLRQTRSRGNLMSGIGRA
jgi:hypothetical protein